MRKYTKEEIEAKVEELWPDAGKWLSGTYYNPTGIKVDPDYNGSVHIEIGDMYSAPGFTFKQLMELANFFETDSIVDIEHDDSGGCETCDYGSYHSFTLEIKPGNWPLGGKS